MLVCPVIIAPDALSFETAVASIGDLKPLRIKEAAEDCIPLTRMLSLIAIGIPSINESYSFFSILDWAASASRIIYS